MGKFEEPGKLFLMAYREGKPVARAGFKVHGHEAIHFGYFEALPGTHEEVRALFAEGQKLAPNLPLRGPHQFRLEDPYTGLLIKGFEYEPHLFMSYHPPYYLELLESVGFVKNIDLFTYFMSPETIAKPEFFGKRCQRARERGLVIRNLDKAKISTQVGQIASIFNQALADNWGFEPIEGEQLSDLLLLAKVVLDPKMVFLAYLDQEPVGCAIILPNLNPMFKASRGGVNFTLLSKYLTRSRWVDSYRGYAVGIRPDYVDHEVGALLMEALLIALSKSGWKHGEISWVLEDNRRMRMLAGALGGVHHKTYRLLQRPVS